MQEACTKLVTYNYNVYDTLYCNVQPNSQLISQDASVIMYGTPLTTVNPWLHLKNSISCMWNLTAIFKLVKWKETNKDMSELHLLIR